VHAILLVSQIPTHKTVSAIDAVITKPDVCASFYEIAEKSAIAVPGIVGLITEFVPMRQIRAIYTIFAIHNPVRIVYIFGIENASRHKTIFVLPRVIGKLTVLALLVY
jgi:hypothetical protein